jgi:hypothetical protein
MASANASAGGAFVPSADQNITGQFDFTPAPTIRGSEVPVTTTAAQTLTNKTFSGGTISATTVAAPVITEYAASGAIALPTAALSVVNLTKAGVAAMTLANPTSAQEGCILVINTETAQAHTVDNSAGAGFNAGGAGADVGTFGGAKGDGFVLIALNNVWNVVVSKNVTLG